MKAIGVILILFVTVVVGQIILSTKKSCSCYQLSTETECNQFTPYCLWGVNSQNVGSCQENQCIDIEGQTDCLKLVNCIWSGSSCSGSTNSTSNCASLTATSTLSCQQQNRLCFGTQGQCISQNQLSDCSSYTTQQNCKFGNEGKCTWSGNGCYFYQNCQQIPATQCSSFTPYETGTPNGQYCQVNIQGVCDSVTCSDLTTQDTCTYVQTVFNQDQFILCSWNGTTCSNAISAHNLTQDTCLTNTLLNYRWLANNEQTTEGICFQCQLKLPYGTSQCLCEQLIAELDCMNAVPCTWQSNRCVTTACSQVSDQQTCSQSPACMWVFGQGCQTFTRCSDLKGVNQFQCLAQSTQCASSNGIYCTQFQKGIDNLYSMCQQITYQSLCTNSLFSFGFCLWNQYSNSCSQGSCYSLSQGQCESFSKQCYWVGYYCNQAQCYNFNNENDCTYYNYYGTTYYCQWDQTTRQCFEADPTDLSYQSCYTNTVGQYRWSSHDNKVGTCVQCSSALLPNRNQKCECSQLIYQGDCALASESCTWNFDQFKCVNLDCTTLRTRGTCISNHNCHWIQRDSIMECLPFKSCDKLPGTNSYQCMLYSYRCTSSDGQYCKELSYTNTANSCSTIPNYTACYLTVARDGVCRWNEQEQKCYSLQDCNEITMPSLCGINNYACYWNYVTESCQPVSCEMVTTESECTYFDKTIGTTPSIQMCLWNQTCVNATSASDFNSADCFINSGRTHYWSTDNSTDGSCKSCSYSYIQVSLIAIAIGIII